MIYSAAAFDAAVQKNAHYESVVRRKAKQQKNGQLWGGTGTGVVGIRELSRVGVTLDATNV